MKAAFDIPRVRRAKGYRSKAPARDERMRVCSYSFNSSDLAHTVSETSVECRGSAVLTKPADVALGEMARRMAWAPMQARP